MKQVASILLLSVFLYNIIGYYFVFSVSDMENRSHMNELVQNEKDLETIRIPRSELKNIVFTEGEKEISYKGEMYDVKSRSVDGDYVVFHCLSDKKETSLLANLDDQVKNNMDARSSSEKKQNNSTKNPVKDLFCTKQNILGADFSFFSFPTADCRLQTVNLPFLSPPPDRV